MKNRRISQFLPLQILCFALLCLEGQSSVLAAAKSNATIKNANQENSTEATVVDVGTKIDNIQPGGKGRYLLLHLSLKDVIGVFDVREKKIIGQIPLKSNEIQFAAGIKTAVVLDTKNKTITSWDIATQMKRVERKFESENFKVVLCGAGTDGPIRLISVSDRSQSVVSVDIDTLNLNNATTSTLPSSNSQFSLYNNHYVISTNGTLFGSNRQGVWYYQSGERWKLGPILGGAAPIANGQFVVNPFQVLTKTRTKVLDRTSQSPANLRVQRITCPSPSDQLYFQINATRRLNRSKKVNDPRAKNDDANISPATLFVARENQPLLDLDFLLPFNQLLNQRSAELPLTKQLFHSPAENQIVQVEVPEMKLHCFPFELKNALLQCKRDFIVVESNPPIKAAVGEDYVYQINAHSQDGEIQYSIDAGPEGMTVSPSGLVKWSPTAQARKATDVVIQLASGRKTYQHAISIDVRGGLTAAKPTGTILTSKTKTPPVTPAKIGATRLSTNFPAPFSKVIAAGAGRYLCLQIPDGEKIAIFDVSLLKVVGYIPVFGTDFAFCAGKEKLFVFDNASQTVSRWNLADRKLETTSKIESDQKVVAAELGAGRLGPVHVLREKSDQFQRSVYHTEFDVESFAFTKSSLYGRYSLSGSPRDVPFIRTSTFGSNVLKPQNFIGFQSLDSNSMGFRNDSHQRICISANGNFFLNTNQVFNRKKRFNFSEQTRLGFCVPAITGNYFLTFDGSIKTKQDSKPIKTLSAKLRSYSCDRVLLKPQSIKLDADDFLFSDRESPLVGRVFYIPEANVVLTTPNSMDRLVAYRLDLESELKQSGVEYLYVDSDPNFALDIGDELDYQIKVKSNDNSKLAFEILSGPSGMTVDDKGLIRWKVPPGFIPTSYEKNRGSSQPDHIVVTVNVADQKRQSAKHRFLIEFPKIEERRIARQEEERLARLKEYLAVSLSRFESRRNSVKKQLDQSFRIWTDATGVHQIEAKFQRIAGLQLVVVSQPNGVSKEILLTQLSSADIHFALAQQQLLEQEEIYQRVTEIATILEQKDAATAVKEIFAASYLESIQKRDEGALSKHSEKIVDPSFIRSLYNIDASKPKLRRDRRGVIIRDSTRSFDLVSFKRENGKLKLTSLP